MVSSPPAFSDARLRSQPTMERAAKAIREADAFVFTAGAGMSVDSGLPDFRGPEGFWRCYPPMQKLGLAFADCSNPAAFRRDPRFAWGFFGHRYNIYSTVRMESERLKRKFLNSTLIRINPADIAGPRGTISICGRAKGVLDALNALGAAYHALATRAPFRAASSAAAAAEAPSTIFSASSTSLNRSLHSRTSSGCPPSSPMSRIPRARASMARAADRNPARRRLEEDHEERNGGAFSAAMRAPPLPPVASAAVAGDTEKRHRASVHEAGGFHDTPSSPGASRPDPRSVVGPDTSR